MQRQFHSHGVDDLNRSLRVFSTDSPAANGSHHDYLIEMPMTEDQGGGYSGYTLRFHNPDHLEGATNGITEEALLTVLADRLYHRSIIKGADPAGKIKAATAAVHQALSCLGVSHASPTDSRETAGTEDPAPETADGKANESAP